MFGSRRQRPRSSPLTAATANPNAATAAASAFNRRGSTPNLSSAAAAAALKARPTTPTNVAAVQTKRTLRRSGSVSSVGSGDSKRPDLRRSPSAGSMTERTFRTPSPSPHRPASSRNPDVPPVPHIPAHVDPRRETERSPNNARSTSLQMQPFRVASQKTKAGHGSWFGPAAGDTSSVRTSDAAIYGAVERLGSISPSINFSYPRSTRLGSPTEESPAHETALLSMQPRPSSIASDQSLVFDPNSRRMVPRAELLAREQELSGFGGKPAKKKKQDPPRAGTHLAQGTVARPKGTIVESENRSPPRQETKVAWEDPDTRAILQQPPGDARDVTEPKIQRATLDQSTEPISRNPAPIEKSMRRGDGVARLPQTSTSEPVAYREHPQTQIHEMAGGQLSHQRVTEALDAVPVKSSTQRMHQSPVELSTEGAIPADSMAENDEAPPAQFKHHDSARVARVHSNSPQRTAHFAAPTDQLTVPVRHSPPPRSLSPRKSALKQSMGPNRGSSPSDDGSEVRGTDANAATAVAPAPEETAGPRKKSVRVSFDDENTVVVGQAAPQDEPESPILHSPQARRPWYGSLTRGQKKDTTSLDDDEVMKPRPALPSFGSVREKKPRESEERPLVRPHESRFSPPPSRPSPIPPTGYGHAEIADETSVQSSDHAIGGILAQDHADRAEANISRFREPLPPVVTSIEGSGYVSNSSTSSDEESDDETAVLTEPEPNMPPEQVKREITSAAETPQNGSTKLLMTPVSTAHEDIPSIAISQASPLLPKAPSTSTSDTEHIDVPGAFPDDNSDTSDKRSATESGTTDWKTPAVPEGKTQPTAFGTPQHLSVAEEESDSSAIYSDAYEDLSDVDGDGFMSLDAVLTSPVSAKTSQKLYERALSASKDAPATTSTPETAPQGSIPSDTEVALVEGPDLDWEQAKAFWRSLTMERRRQLEREAAEEAGEEGDLEELHKAKKAKKKKSSERKVETSDVRQQPVNGERIYQIKPGTRVADAEDRPRAGTMRTTLRGPQSPQAAETLRLRRTMRERAAQSLQDTGTTVPHTLRTEKAQSQATIGTKRPPPPDPSSASAADGVMRKSLRSSGTPPVSSRQPKPQATAKVERPLSLQPQPTNRLVRQSHQRTFSMDSTNPSRPSTMASLIRPSLRRRGSESSESSFKRARPRPSEGLGFRKSMRANQAPASPASDEGKSSRFSLRSLSPAGSPFRRSSATGPMPPVSLGNRLRSTLRNDSSDGSTRRMRIPSFGRSAQKKAGKKGKSSRFGDSSDEDDGFPTFQSRFADSDDDEKPRRARPASQGMPKTMRSTLTKAASPAAAHIPSPTDEGKEPKGLASLSNSSEGEQAPRSATLPTLPASKSENGRLQRQRSGRGTLITSTTAPALGTRAVSGRGNLMAVLRRRRDTSAKIRRPALTDSAARQDTKLERSASQLSAIRASGESPDTAVANWPLPDVEDGDVDGPGATLGATPPADEEKKRPATAVEPSSKASFRPDFAKRRSTSHSLFWMRSGSGNPGEIPELKKKKKFGTLRRIFGLDD